MIRKPRSDNRMEKEGKARNIGEKNPNKLTWDSIKKLQKCRVPWLILPSFFAVSSLLIGRAVPVFYTGLSLYLQGLTETNMIKTQFGIAFQHCCLFEILLFNNQFPCCNYAKFRLWGFLIGVFLWLGCDSCRSLKITKQLGQPNLIIFACIWCSRGLLKLFSH